MSLPAQFEMGPNVQPLLMPGKLANNLRVDREWKQGSGSQRRLFCGSKDKDWSDQVDSVFVFNVQVSFPGGKVNIKQEFHLSFIVQRTNGV